ncbi:hypothetical protein PVIIG_05781 [Plasmodium vivax India VII]|uniref:Variable surface protein Vir35 n=1 Tax=Plasmodium vivax India VII TaxID=1077284 RepID=A0A0J9S1F2_PLAVI|nr:hypothetical protein PVIIG_05781 [Plasmodium vivax India VII]
MAILRNYNIRKNSQLCKSLEIIYKQDKTWNTKYYRLLARHEQLRDLERTRLREKLPDIRLYTEKGNVSHNISAYSHVKGNESNNIDVYMKNYKKRYMRKKGLSKLDCYYENKVFRKFNNICDIGKKMQYDKKLSKRFFFKKYGIGLILFSLIPALGLLFPILFGIRRGLPGILGECPRTHILESHNYKHKDGTDNNDGIKNCATRWLHEQKDTIQYFSYLPIIFSFTMIIIVVSVVIYILIKVIKYEKIKAGKGKMNRREYIDFCKKVFKNEKY